MEDLSIFRSQSENAGELNLREIADKNNIPFEVLKQAFDTLGRNPEIAENLAGCLRKKNISNGKSFAENIIQECNASGLNSNYNPILIANNLDVAAWTHFQRLFKVVKNNPDELINQIEMAYAFKNQYFLTLFRQNPSLLTPEKIQLYLKIIAAGSIQDKGLLIFLRKQNLTENDLQTLLNYYDKLQIRENKELGINAAFRLMALGIPLEEIDKLSDEALIKAYHLSIDLPADFKLNIGYPQTIANYEVLLKEACNTNSEK